MGAISEFYGNTGNSSWNLHSRKDPRWNCSGRGGEAAMQARIDAMKSELGCDPPDDLEFSAFKD